MFVILCFHILRVQNYKKKLIYARGIKFIYKFVGIFMILKVFFNFYEKKCKNIWSCQKKVVPLHAFSRVQRGNACETLL